MSVLMLSRWNRRLLVNIASLGIFTLICFLIGRSIEWSRLWSSLKAANWPLVILAAVINIVFNNIGRVMRFSVLISRLEHDGPRPSFWQLTSILLSTRALNAALPAKAGETFRAYQMKRRFGYPVEGVLALLMIEPLIEALGLALPALALLIVLPPPAAIARPFYVIAVIGLAGLCAGMLIALRHAKTDPGANEDGSWFQRAYFRLMNSLHLVSSPKLWAKAVGWTWFADWIDLLMIGLCLAALGMHLSMLAWFIVLVTVNVAIVIPATPGSIGLLEAGAVLALGALGIDSSKALLFALFYHAAHLLPVAAVGSLLLHGSTVLGPSRRAEA